MIDHCVSAFLEIRKEELYRAYVTDALKAIGNLNIRYMDYFKPVETRTSDEIIDNIKNKLNTLGGNKE